MTHRNRVRLSKLSLALIAAFAMAPAFAQSTSAGLGGRVVGADGQPVAGAAVTIVHAESGTVSRAVTDANGRYTARGLRVGGPYTVTVEQAGRGTKSQSNVYLGLDKVANVDLSLAPQELETISVVGAGFDTFQPDNKGLGTNMTRADMDRMPTPDRSIQNIVRADPRVVVTDRDRGAFSASGQNFRYNSITIDTINAGDPFGLNDNGLPTKGTPVSQDAIEEYNISTANYDVATRRGVGATVNAVTKSGTNDLHGSAYWVYQNANNMIGENDKGKKWEGYDHDQLLGFTLGGPILKDKLFFFASLEKQKKDGIGSITGPIDSNATLRVPGITQQFIDDVTAAAIANGMVPGDNGQAPDMDTDRYLFKFDWNINDAHRASLRLNQTKEFEPIVVNGTVTGSSPRLALSSNWYTLDKKSTSYALSFYDDWSENFSTEASVGYNEFNQDRDPMVGGHQPAVLVRVSGSSGPGIFLGTEPPTHANRLNVKSWNGYFAGSWYLGDHVVKGGVDYQSDDVYNLFLQNYNGNYEFNGLVNFQDGVYNRYQVAVPAPGYTLDNVAALMEMKQYGFFLQDTWQVNNDLSVQYGLRYDVPEVSPDPAFNPCFAAAPGTLGDLGPCGLRANPNNPNAAIGGYGYPNTGTIDGNAILQPRASFNYLINETMQIRGGAGLFISNTPAVWVANPYSNTGIAVSTYDVGPFNPANPSVTPPFNPDGSTQTQPGVALVPPGLGSSTMTLAVVDPDFDLPTVAKYTFGFDMQLPFLDSVFTVEGQYVDTIHGIKYDNINLGAPTGVLPDGRLAYQRDPNGTTTTGNNSVHQVRWNANPSFGQNILLTNTDKGEAANLTFLWRKPMADGWTAQITFTQARATDVNPGTSSVASSSYGNRDWFNPNADYVATSNYNIPQRFTVSGTWEHAFWGNNMTRISAFYDGHSGAPYSWVFGNDVNGDSTFRDLAYIPANRTDVSFAPGTSQASIDSFFTYIANNTYLIKNQGEIFNRNSARAPWVNQLDMTFAQDLPGFAEEHKAEIRLDIFNFLNLLNSDWGVEHRASFPLERTLANVTGIDAQGRYIYNITPYLDANGNYAPTPLPVNENFTPSQRWAATVTLRYEF